MDVSVMGRSASSIAMTRGVSFDWTVIALAVAAAAILAVTMIRTDGTPGVMPPRIGGLHVLTPADHVVAFEDYTFNASDWAQDATSETGLGRVLGPFSGETLMRSFTLPDGTASATLSLDLYLWDGADRPAITTNGVAMAPVVSNAATHADNALHEHLVIAVSDPGGALDVSIVGAGDGQWALDNLSLIASLPESAP